jgi:PKD repeat protein
VKTKLLIPVAFIAVLAILAGCGKEPTACFTFTSASIDNEDLPFVGEDIDFENCSENADSYEWDFGDDATSTKTNPTHAYDAPGEYTVTLTATNSDGSKSSSQTIEVQASLTGTWEGEMTVDGSTDVYPIIFEIEQNGTELSGSFQFSDGSGYSTLGSTSEIDGQDVTIKFIEPSYSMNFTFTGQANTDFDQMDGDYTMTMSGGGLSGSWDVSKTSKKSAINPNSKGLESFLKKL